MKVIDDVIRLIHCDHTGTLAIVTAFLLVLVVTMFIDAALRSMHTVRLVVWMYSIVSIQISLGLSASLFFRISRSDFPESIHEILTAIIATVWCFLLTLVAPFFLAGLLFISLPTQEMLLAGLYIYGITLGIAAPIATVICLWRRHMINRRLANRSP